MNVTQQNNRKRDWTLIIFILPLGVAMMLCVGQLAIRMSPNWSVEGEMKSFLDPEKAAKQESFVIQPISGDILTPMSWWNTFLTPSGDSGPGIVFPPFIVFEPTLTPTATASPTADTPSPTATSSLTSTPTPPTNTPTTKPTDDDETPLPSATTVSPSPTTPSPSPTTPYPSPTTPSPSPTTPSPSPTATTPAPITSTPSGTQTAVPGNTTIGTPDGNFGGIPDGNYIVINLTLSATPIVVTNPSETNYDFVYYERPIGGGVDMDSVIISISMDDIDYYVVFNWGDNQPDDNSNIDLNNLPPPPGSCTDVECDNQHINGSELHNSTGILVDVDNAPSNPPPGDYWYIAIEAPLVPPNDGNDGADVDAIEIAENTPTP